LGVERRPDHHVAKACSRMTFDAGRRPTTRSALMNRAGSGDGHEWATGRACLAPTACGKQSLYHDVEGVLDLYALMDKAVAVELRICCAACRCVVPVMVLWVIGDVCPHCGQPLHAPPRRDLLTSRSTAAPPIKKATVA